MMAMFVTGVGGGLLGLLYCIFWIWMLIDAITNKSLSGNEKILWVVVVILLPCLGPILYFFIGRKKA
jgi:Phospholipase_D-nuclease N-terminal